MNRKKIKIAAGFVFSIAALVIIFPTVDFNEVWTNLQRLSWPVVSIVLILYLINMILRSIRWKLIIAQEYRIDFFVVFKAMTYGFMLNQLLPAKMGEIARAEYLTRKSEGERSFLLGTVIVERIIDILLLSFFLGFSVFFSETVINVLKSNIASLLLFLSISAGGIFLIYNLTILKKVTRFFPLGAEKLSNRVIDSLVKAFKMLKSGQGFIFVLLLSFLIWSLLCISFLLILKDLYISIPFYAYLFIVSAGTFGMIIPSTSANLGVYHAVAMGSLMLFMVPKDQAMAFAIIAHAFDFLPGLILGGILFGYSRLTELKPE